MASWMAWRGSTAGAAAPSRGRAAAEWPRSWAAGARFAQAPDRVRPARRWTEAQARATAHAAKRPTQDGQHEDGTRETLDGERQPVTATAVCAPPSPHGGIARRLSRHVGTPRPTR